jgi:hypothetical protein
LKLHTGSILGLCRFPPSGRSVEDARLGQPELFALGMAASMSLPIVAWMRHRGHSWRNGAEMSAASGGLTGSDGGARLGLELEERRGS